MKATEAVTFVTFIGRLVCDGQVDMIEHEASNEETNDRHSCCQEYQPGKLHEQCL